MPTRPTWDSPDADPVADLNDFAREYRDRTMVDAVQMLADEFRRLRRATSAVTDSLDGLVEAPVPAPTTRQVAAQHVAYRDYIHLGGMRFRVYSNEPRHDGTRVRTHRYLDLDADGYGLRHVHPSDVPSGVEVSGNALVLPNETLLTVSRVDDRWEGRRADHSMPF